MENLELRFLNQVRNNLKFADDKLIKRAIVEMKNKPMSLAKINVGNMGFIDRATIHKKEFRANEVQRLSYIKDKELLKSLKKHGTFGRANLPGIPIFYGAMASPEIEIPRAVAFMETSNMPYDDTINEEYFTLSRWSVQEEFLVYEVAFADTDQKSALTIDSFEKQSSFIQEISSHQLRVEAVKQLEFFSEEFSKVVKRGEDHDYKISAIFTDVILNHRENQGEVHGIAYPSVKSGHLGLNVALTPYAVDNFLKFEFASVMRAFRDKDGTLVIGKSTERADVQNDNSTLIWSNIKH